jgi:lipoprotein signal peptidase
VRVSDRLLLVVGPAAMLASVDLIVKATVPTGAWAFHHRSDVWVALSIALLVGAAVLCVVPSPAVALAAGVMSAGVIGNLVSARANGDSVPNPLTISHGNYTLAFNLADVFFLLGNLLLMTALIVEIVRNRDRLAPPRGWERALLRRLSGPRVDRSPRR